MITAICIAVIVLLVAADYLIKWIVVSNMQYGESIPAIKGLLNWTYITNDGASWGILSGKTWFLITVTTLLIAAIIVYICTGRMKNKLCLSSLVLVAAGGIGNLIDRVFNSGKVVDYIDVSPLFDFPVFNLADCCVTVGGVLFCIYVIFFYDDKKKDEEKENINEAI